MTEGTSRRGRALGAPGPIYDNAMRWLAADDLGAICDWLGVHAEAGAIRLSEALAGTTRYVDLLIRPAPGRLTQVEFVRDAQADMGLRMLDYRARIMGEHRGVSVTQHVVILGRGKVPAIVRDRPDLMMRLHVTYLRTHDPALLLSSAALAPLASLGRLRTTQRRAEVLTEALGVIAASTAGAKLEGLALTASVLATIYLKPSTITTAWEEAHMPISFADTDLAKELTRQVRQQGLEQGREQGLEQGREQGLEQGREQGREQGLEQGLEQGREQGLEQGLEQGREEFAAVLLRRRFGDDDRIPATATRLAAQPADVVADAIESAASLDDLA